MSCYRIRTPFDEVPFLVRASDVRDALAQAARAAGYETEEISEEAFTDALNAQPEERQRWQEYWDKEELIQRLVALSTDEFQWVLQEVQSLRSSHAR